jgi:dimethylhistidine N-methyltransferase
LEPWIEDFEASVFEGLSQENKSIPCRFLYDDIGSRLFDRICTLPEYYPMRCEAEILCERSQELSRLLPSSATVIEWGAGSTTKAALLLRSLRSPITYVPIDISQTRLVASSAAMLSNHQDLAVIAVRADFAKPITLPDDVPLKPRIGFFPGSTIGNFSPAEAVLLLRQIGLLLGPGGWLIIGVDLKKNPRLLHAAYNDAEGVTAAFNLNLLNRINRELGGHFDRNMFLHHAFYAVRQGRIEMHICSAVRQEVWIGERRFGFREHETIHSENSYKYAIDEFVSLSEEAGFDVVRTWTDRFSLFSMHVMVVR